MTTPRGSPELVSAQPVPETTVNEQARRVEALAAYGVVADRVTAPPGSCADGAVYLIIATATGAFASKENKLAIAVGANAASGWLYRTPGTIDEGLKVYVQDEDSEYLWNGSAWGAVSLGSGITLDTDGSLAANSDTKVPSQKAVKTYVDTAVTGLLDYKGTTDCSANPNYPAASKGDAYIVSVAGKIGGASGTSVDAGDWFIAKADNAGGTEASVGTSWGHVEHNVVISDVAYDATTWDGNLDAPTKNAVRDKIETLSGSIPGAFTTEDAQDATGAMVDTTLEYVDATPLLRRAALTGDVTAAAGSNTTTIANSAVTLAKIANASANSKLVGSGSSGSGAAYSEITLGTNLSMSGTTLSASGIVGGSGGLVGVQVITATGAGTYTPTTGTTKIIIELVGAGAGGSGVASPGTTNSSRGVSGGSGAYLRKLLSTAFSGASYSVGAKGTGGSSGANAGNNGGDTTFTATGGGGTVYTAGGGIAGSPSTSAPTPVIGSLSTSAGGTATNGDINIPGQYPDRAMSLSASNCMSGRGANGLFGSGGFSTIVGANATNAGNNATGYGAGGSAAVANGSGAANNGGDGSNGIIIIWEYS